MSITEPPTPEEAAERLAAYVALVPSYARAKRLADRYRAVQEDPAQSNRDGCINWTLPCPAAPRGYEAQFSLSLEPDDATPFSFECDGMWDRAGYPKNNPCRGAAMLRAALEPPDLHEFVATVHSPMLDPEQVIIPGTLAVGDRAIVTGREGDGKSELLRQWGYMVAAGVHPITLEAITPRRVLYVNLEISPGNVRDALAGLMTHCPAVPAPGMFLPVNRPGGIDLLDPADQAWLKQQAAGCHLVVIGPLRKMTPASTNDEAVAKPLCAVLDELRPGSALLIEAHQGKDDDKEPVGSSYFMAWPEFGLHLSKSGKLTHWRGSRLPDRIWPEKLVGAPPRPGKPSPWPTRQPWPWIAVTGKPASTDAGNPLVELLRVGGNEQQVAEAVRAGAVLPSASELKAAGIAERTGQYRRAAVQKLLAEPGNPTQLVGEVR